jgi:hypothetical protein
MFEQIVNEAILESKAAKTNDVSCSSFTTRLIWKPTMTYGGNEEIVSKKIRKSQRWKDGKLLKKMYTCITSVITRIRLPTRWATCRCAI